MSSDSKLGLPLHRLSTGAGTRSSSMPTDLGKSQQQQQQLSNGHDSSVLAALMPPALARGGARPRTLALVTLLALSSLAVVYLIAADPTARTSAASLARLREGLAESATRMRGKGTGEEAKRVTVEGYAHGTSVEVFLEAGENEDELAFAEEMDEDAGDGSVVVGEHGVHDGSAKLGAFVADELDSLPEITLEGGTRYVHVLPQSWPDPWPRVPKVVRQWFSPKRFPPPAGVDGIEADTPANQAARKQARNGIGTKPPREIYEAPKAYTDAAFTWASKRGEWLASTGLMHPTESFDSRGRPNMIDREHVFLGPPEYEAPMLVSPAPKDASARMRKVQADFARLVRSKPERVQDNQRKEWVRRAFLHVWEAYKANAWGYDELRPLSGKQTNKFNGWGGTIIDALDTLLIMDLKEEYMHARKHVAQVDFTFLTPGDPTAYPSPAPENLPPLDQLRQASPFTPLPNALRSPPALQLFEIVIRMLGGMISAYDMTGDPLMLSRAKELGDWLLPAFATRSGLPRRDYKPGTNPAGGETGTSVLAEVGSLSLEFTRLSQVTGDPAYFKAISRVTDSLDSWQAIERLPHLFPITFDDSQPAYLNGQYSFGGQGDSWYEYLTKMHQLLQGSTEQYARMYSAAIDSAHTHLIRPIKVVPGMDDLVTFGDVHLNDRFNGRFVSWYASKLDHLLCFAGGMLGLGSRLLSRARDFDTATRFTDACIWAFNATVTGLSPETMQLFAESDLMRWEVVTLADGRRAKRVRGDPIGCHSARTTEIGRPETIESIYYMYRLTGDRRYQDAGWQLLTSWVEHSIVDGGFAQLDDVTLAKPNHEDGGIESFVYAETFKYYYLLFSDPADKRTSLDEWVLSTEAHPFRIPTEAGLKDSHPFWSAKDPPLTMPGEEASRGDPKWHELEIGRGTPVQNWARLMQAAHAAKGDPAVGEAAARRLSKKSARPQPPQPPPAAVTASGQPQAGEQSAPSA